MIFDSHTHIFPPQVIRERARYCDDGNFSHLYSDPKARMIDADALVQSMDEAGIDCAAAMGFPWEDMRRCSEQNEYFHSVKSRFGGRVYPFASVPAGDRDGIRPAVKDIASMGLCGIGETAFYEGLNEDTVTYLHVLLESAEEHSLPVCLHVNEPVGHGYPGKYEPQLGMLYGVIKDHPSVTIILAHWGGGLLFYEMMPEVKKALGNVFYDSAATPYLYEQRIYSQAVSITGAEKILYGSDYPLIPFKRCVDQVINALPDEADRDLVLGGNAARILKISC